jgi:hypothetical protein
MIGDGKADQGHLVPAVSHLENAERPAYLGFLFDVSQVNDVVEQEHEPVQRLVATSVRSRFAGDQY